VTYPRRLKAVNLPDVIGKDRCAVRVKALTGNWLKLPFAWKEATAVRLMQLIEKLFQI